MTAFRITPARSVHTTADFDHAFDGDSAGADTLTVDQGAFLITEGFVAAGALLANTGAWTVNVNGSIVSDQGDGIYLSAGNTGVSTITVGAEGEISGYSNGISALSSANINNSGVITASGSGSGIAIGAGTHTITNAGTINARYAIFDANGLSDDSVTNVGQINGDVVIGGGTNRLVNSGTIKGYISGGGGVDTLQNSGLIDDHVDLDAGADVFTNFRTVNGVVVNGTVTGTVFLGDGNDRFTGGANAESVADGSGADLVSLGGGNDVYRAASGATADRLDTINGEAGIDTYDASAANGSVAINLDTVAHDLSPLSPGAGLVAAGTASGAEVAGASVDRIAGFENAFGGSAGDVIYGSAGGNYIDGGGGTDFLFGFGGNDHLVGGASLDNLVGGAGRDTLTGGADADSFTFVALSDSGRTAATRDVIAEFEDARDVIALDRIDAVSGTAANDAFAFIGTNVAFGGNAGELRAYWTARGQIVEGDVNGDKVADFSIALADPGHGVVLTSADFIF